jgi:membrane associated rhomboid family serine protease
VAAGRYENRSMGLYDRDYTQADFRSQQQYAPRMRMAFPRLTPVVKWLLIINGAAYFLQIITGDLGTRYGFLTAWFSVRPTGWGTLQLWRYVTYQFLHGDIIHILMNMVGLYFLGPTLERHWKGRKFLMFYLGCGIVGGLTYPLLLALHILSPHPNFGVLPLIGASGAILGMLAACAILFPHFVVFIMFFPVPIRVAAVICILIAGAAILGRGGNAGGEAAHLGGIAAGALYVFSQSWRSKLKLKFRSTRWRRKMSTQQDLQFELDRILKKVHDYGLHSLTRKEKSILKQATEAERMRNKL